MIDAKFMPNQLQKHAVVYNDMHACSAGFARRSIERHAKTGENACRSIERHGSFSTGLARRSIERHTLPPENARRSIYSMTCKTS